MPDENPVGFGDGLDEGELLGFDTEKPSGSGGSPSDESQETSGAESTESKDSTSQATEGSRETASEAESGRDEGVEEAKGSGEGQEEKPAEGKDEPPATEAASGEELEVFGKKYPDIKSAFHALKSQYGQMRSWQERYRQLEQQFNELKESVETRQSKDAPSATPPTAEGTAPDAKGKPQKFVDSIDWDFVDKLANDPDYGPAKAQQYVAAEMEKAMEAELDRKVDERLKQTEERLQPVDELLQSNEVARKAMESFSALQQRTNEDGSPTFPELDDQNGDPEFIQRVVTRWRDNPALRDQGEYGAYLAYLDEQRWNQYLGSRLPDAPSKGIDEKIEADNSSAAAAVSENGGGAPMPGTKAKESFQSRFKKSLYQDTGDTEDAGLLGF